MLQDNCLFSTPSIIHQKVKKRAKFHCCRNFLAGVSGLSHRSLRPPGFSCPLARVWCGTGHPSGVTPEGARSLWKAGVSGPWWPESPASPTSSTSLRPGAEYPASPEFPVPRTRVSGLRSSMQSVGSYGCLPRRNPGRRPECPANSGVSGPLRPESPA